MWTLKVLSRKPKPNLIKKLSRSMRTPASVKHSLTETTEDPCSIDGPKKPPPLRADNYAKNNGLQRKHSSVVLDFCQPAFSAECDSSMQFLDVGCGTGDFTRDCLVPRCHPCRRIVATDWSSDMIEYATSHSGHEKIEYQELDIAGDGVDDFLRRYGRFHRVYSFYCLHWVKKQDVALKNISELLRPGGECLLLFPASNQPTASWQILAGMERWAKYSEVLLSLVPESENMIDKQEQMDYMSSLLHDAGLSPTIFVLPRLTTFDGCSEKDMIGLHMGIVPIAAMVSDEERPQLFEDVRALVHKLHGPETDQSRFRMYVIQATKRLRG